MVLAICKTDGKDVGQAGDIHGRCFHCRSLGDYRSDLWIQRHLAISYQHGDDVITFLMVFLIQNTQNRDSEAMQVKLDELIRATHGAQNALLDLEELEEEELDRIKAGYEEIAEKARGELRR